MTGENAGGGVAVTPEAEQRSLPGSSGQERSSAADDPPRLREVTGFDGTYIEAVDAGIYEIPPPMVWGSWQTYR